MTTSLALANHIIDGSGEVVRYLKEATHYVVYDEQERTEVADLFAPINIVVVLPKEIDNIGK